jgi:hypothetical protein
MFFLERLLEFLSNYDKRLASGASVRFELATIDDERSSPVVPEK